MSPADQFAALADPTRCRVVELLAERARPVHELAASFAISRPAISRHLRILKEAELVAEEKRGRENVYALQRNKLKPVADWLTRHWHAKLFLLKESDVRVPTAQMELEL
jgi:DNA-binding transcriptional ArsR family regulator